MNKVCYVCGKSFSAKRSDAKTCSDLCRQNASRGIFAVGSEGEKKSEELKTAAPPDTRCKVCPVCLYPDWKGTLMYPEDEDGVPYCNSEGPLTDRNREILSKKVRIVPK